MVDCLPGVPPGPPGPPLPRTRAPSRGPGAPVAGRLWSRLCGQRPAPGLMRALSAALVLLADHELAASTLAARAAASVRADPYAVVGTGLGAMSGALHGGASLGAETLMAAASGPRRRAPGGGRVAAPGREGPRFRAFRVPRRRPARHPPARPGAPGRTEVRASSRWPTRCSPRSGRSPCPSRTSTSPWPPWPGWRAWSAARARRYSRWPGRRAGSRTPWRPTPQAGTVRPRAVYTGQARGPDCERPAGGYSPVSPSICSRSRSA